ncbi:DNA-directed RNA polymerase subunit omega [Petrotoga sp. 9PWA.NaAc.5.4]|uniref:DNA-directed RNA polymerase subunit omega n=1 Tax=Petrotoga sp. 9PWA.NaAc.5.4 TaxID=1434328 RepID=UPI000CBDF383|nr:DNA-directed RNA polymerase subunit omega [Petrotoga sp. 9PWA.NaAc.5.4]PNR92485.1 DNA-directed RNA polymerase subunit omega [Petrotoga sp. 9PWA.NaAc.5.4]
MSLDINFDKILKKVRFKYAVPIIAAKRAEALRNLDELNGIEERKDYVSIALKELESGKITVKNLSKLENDAKILED